MTETILAQIFELNETGIDSHESEFIDLLNGLRPEIGYEPSEKIYNAVMLVLYEARQEAFKAGWQMRAQL